MNLLPDFLEFLTESEYSNFIVEFVNEMATNKDIKRIEDIIIKSKGSEQKQIQLATTMTNLIKDKQKSLQRYEAALEVLGLEHPVTQIFADKAKSLGNDVKLAKSIKPSTTLGKLGSSSGATKNLGGFEKRSRKSRYEIPILPIGSTNLVTGKCKYFDIYETWGKDNGSTIELWSVEYHWSRTENQNPKYKLVITSGSTPMGKIGENMDFVHDQTRRPLFSGKMIDWVNIGDAELLVREYKIKAAQGYVYK